MLAVTLAAVPTNPVSDAFVPQTDYLSPFFGQSWRLFAPNPVDEDKTLLVQGAYVDDDGTSEHDHGSTGQGSSRTSSSTAWWAGVPATSPRSSTLARRGVPGARESQEQKRSRSEPAHSILRRGCTAGLPRPHRPRRRRPGRLPALTIAPPLAWPRMWSRRGRRTRITAVRYALREQGVTPYDDRHLDKAGRQEARPEIRPCASAAGVRPRTARLRSSAASPTSIGGTDDAARPGLAHRRRALDVRRGGHPHHDRVRRLVAAAHELARSLVHLG